VPDVPESAYSVTGTPVWMMESVNLAVKVFPAGMHGPAMHAPPVLTSLEPDVAGVFDALSKVDVLMKPLVALTLKDAPVGA